MHALKIQSCGAEMKIAIQTRTREKKRRRKEEEEMERCLYVSRVCLKLDREKMFIRAFSLRCLAPQVESLKHTCTTLLCTYKDSLYIYRKYSCLYLHRHRYVYR